MRTGGQIECLVPARLPEHLGPARRIDRHGTLGHPRQADQRARQAVGMVGVVEAEAALDAQPAVVGRAVAAGDVVDLLGALCVAADVQGQLAADAAVGANRIDLALDLRQARAARRHQRRRSGRPARTRRTTRTRW